MGPFLVLLVGVGVTVAVLFFSAGLCTTAVSVVLDDSHGAMGRCPTQPSSGRCYLTGTTAADVPGAVHVARL